MAAVALAVALSDAAPAVAQAKWGAPFQLTAPGTLDLLAPQLAISSRGDAAAAFGIQDVDTPGTSRAYLTVRSAAGGVGQPTVIAGASQILALAYDGRALELLTGTSPTGQTCCSSAQATELSAGAGAAAPHTLVAGLAGATQGRLLALADGRLLAAVATERGVWVVQSSKGSHFGSQHLLTGAGQMPESLAAAWLGADNTVVGWTAATGLAGAADPRSIYVSGGTRAGAGRHVAVAVTVPAGHRIDELGLAPHAGGATAAWIESWYDRGGGYHSQVEAMDLAPHAAVRTLSPAGRLASGLTLSGDLGGDQAAAWESCTLAGDCAAQVATRAARGAFGAARTLGPVDPSEAPALSVGSRGQAIAGWIRGGRPIAAVKPGPGREFGSPATLSPSTYAYDITVGSGPGRQGMAAWSQGTLNPSVVAAAYG